MDDLITVKHAAQLLGFNPTTVYYHIRKKHLRAQTWGAPPRVFKLLKYKDVLKFKAERER